MIERMLKRPVMLTIAGAFGCAAMWSLIVKPMQTERDEKQKNLAIQQRQIEQGLKEIERAEVDPARLMQEFSARAEAYEGLWTVSANSAVLYSMFDELASRAGVSIDRIEPSRSGFRIDDGEARLTHNSFVVELRGTYAGILAFIKLTQTGTGLSRVTSLRMSPVSITDDEGQVQAHLVTEHVGVVGLFAFGQEKP